LRQSGGEAVSANRFIEPQSLEGFAHYFLTLEFAHIKPLEFYDFGPVKSLVLYRDAPLQAEFITVLPGQGFPREHRHPDVDVIEYDSSGNTPLIVNGVRVARPKFDRSLHKVNSVDWHGVDDVPRGATFLSSQRWREGVTPTSVLLNWEGTPLSMRHKEMLRQPGAVWIKTVRKNVDSQHGEFVMNGSGEV
jgi:hypothetical protein